jgi:hypothetical protein
VHAIEKEKRDETDHYNGGPTRLYGPSAADPVYSSVSVQAGRSTDTRLFKVTQLLPSSELKAPRFARDSGMTSTLDMIAVHLFQTCLTNISVCVPDGRGLMLCYR